MTDSWVPLAALGGIFLIATGAFKKSSESSGMGLGIGGGGSGFGVSLWALFFGATDGDGGGDASTQKGPLNKPGGSGGTGTDKPDTAGEDGDGKGGNGGSSGQGSDSKGGTGQDDGDGKGSGSSGSGGGYGGGSGGGIGSGTDSNPGDGNLGEGGSKGDDNGGGDDDGIYEYDPYDGKIIDVDLPPPDISETMLNKVRETVRTLINGNILDPGISPDAAHLPPELHTFNIEKGGLLRFWADVALHYNYKLPWGILDDERKSHIPWINLWLDILAYTSKYEWETSGGIDDLPTTTMVDLPKTTLMAQEPKVSRRGLGDAGKRRPLLITREVGVNPLIRSVA
ncbi:MAG: hypothetical protein ACPG4T_01380 [Nannocystaceae bacterium]